MSESILLTVAIPTYNRARFLSELLQSLSQDLSAVNEISFRVELLVCDNASPDSTAAVIQPYLSLPFVRYVRNEKNVGGDYNFTLCVERAKGEYVWIFGDDDLYVQGSLERLLETLVSEKPFLVIGGNDYIGTGRYDSYGALIDRAIESDSLFALRHTLITANIFLRDLFDVAYARSQKHTSYGHMYALFGGFVSGKKVCVFSKKDSLFGVRDIRAEFDEFPEDLAKKQRVYLLRLSRALRSRKLRVYSFWGYTIKFQFKMAIEGIYRRFFKKIFGLVK